MSLVPLESLIQKVVIIGAHGTCILGVSGASGMHAWYLAESIVSQRGVVPLTVGMLQAQPKPSSRSAVVTTKLKP